MKKPAMFLVCVLIAAAQAGCPLPGAVAIPVLSPATGTYGSAQAVTITCATPGAVIHYTTDGVTTPAASSPVYAGPISVSGVGTVTVIQAMAEKAGMQSSGVASARYSIANVAYQLQPLSDATAGLCPSSWVAPGGSDGDYYAYESFVIPSGAVIREVRWRGGYAAGGAYGLVNNFTLRFYATTAAGTQPLTDNPHLTETLYLQSESTGGNAGEISAGTYNGIPMYDYAYVLAAPFTATAGVKYWLKIEGEQPTVCDWGIAKGAGGDGTYYRFSVAGMQFGFMAGVDVAFALLP